MSKVPTALGPVRNHGDWMPHSLNQQAPSKLGPFLAQLCTGCQGGLGEGVTSCQSPALGLAPIVVWLVSAFQAELLPYLYLVPVAISYSHGVYICVPCLARSTPKTGIMPSTIRPSLSTGETCLTWTSAEGTGIAFISTHALRAPNA